ncbi:hypothetical protein FO488_08540 [Geobacter sp. FeAm09]|uniref:Hpt domain-containing protein n=1 Tax=Geobacter sp. FeAm09 TaxID=2597769 RepID=UPI0011EFE8C0|nr:hypothetical protein FO488_08540 [Geobacter sp. FeAm09]
MSDNSPFMNKAVRDFLAEAEEIVEHLGSELADLADVADKGDADPDLLNAIFRGAHSLKGLAGMFGFAGIAELSHNMENLLDWLRLGKLRLDAGVIGVLLESHDVLLSLVRGLSEGEGSVPDEKISACTARINACLEEPPRNAAQASPLAVLGLSEQVVKSLTEYEEHRLLENLSKGRNIYRVHASFDLATFDQDLAIVSDAIKTCGEVISTLPSMSSNMETNIDFDILAGSAHAYDEFALAVRHDRVAVALLNGVPEPPVAADTGNTAVSAARQPGNDEAADLAAPRPRCRPLPPARRPCPPRASAARSASISASSTN